jgi:protein-S-isoprenylcysteine O-methyltransferase Ste14
MPMAIIALILFVAFMLLVGVVRTGIQRRRTGDTGDRRLTIRRSPVQLWGDILNSVGVLAVGVAAPIAALTGLDPLAVLNRPLIQGGGLVLAVLGAVATFGAQAALGDSWRLGVDASERTALVTSGVYGLVRNPIFTAVIVTFAGLALMVPNIIAVAGLAALVIGVQVEVRLDEEPHLRRVHADAYDRYAATVGRFLPGIGRRT